MSVRKTSARRQPFILRTTFYSVLFLFVTGCATHPRPESSAIPASAEWSGYARIDDKVKNSSHSVHLDFLAQKQNGLRLDVTGPMGVHVATLVMLDSDVQILLTRERKYFLGGVSDQALKPLLGIDLNPLILRTLLFEMEPASGWRCERGAEKQLDKCISASGALSVVWQDRTSRGKTIAIHSPKVEVVMHLNPPEASAIQSETVFHLTPPTGYKQYNLN